ncbi:MAG: FKBP-type peptidyl-prolyl cis-trans isomerase [Deltaproteobacteria bacterium]|nr:FKBP-type peptidyl-prolyl cis-trans isomerase [Deltaproteobacteria bacterium]
MLVAIPSMNPGGLQAAVSDHFGHSPGFTLVELVGGEIGQVRVVGNEAHDQGGCGAVVGMLKGEGAQAVVAGGMGRRPLMGFLEEGISVYHHGGAKTVAEALHCYMSDGCQSFGEDQSCQGEDCGDKKQDHGHHHHAPVQRAPIVGDASIQKDRVVSIEYTLTDGSGQVIDTSDGRGPLRYLHGHGQLIPGMESGLGGHLAGDVLRLEVPPEQAYGERDEGRTIEVPREQFPADVQVGMSVRGQTDQGVVEFVVAEVGDDAVVLDANHPLAGVTLFFDVKVVAVEAATPEEIAHGHVH